MEKIEEARQRKLSGRWNCAQAVSCTFSSEVGADEDAMAPLAAAFGTGMGCLEGTCGALVGAGLILGIHHKGNRPEAMKAMRRIMTKFSARNGATLCKALKGVGTGRPLRACEDCVADAAEFLQAELHGKQ